MVRGDSRNQINYAMPFAHHHHHHATNKRQADNKTRQFACRNPSPVQTDVVFPG